MTDKDIESRILEIAADFERKVLSLIATKQDADRLSGVDHHRDSQFVKDHEKLTQQATTSIKRLMLSVAEEVVGEDEKRTQSFNDRDLDRLTRNVLRHTQLTKAKQILNIKEK